MITKSRRKRNPKRTKAILSLLEEGMTPREVAAAFDLSTQRVYQIKNAEAAKRKAAGA